MSEDWAIKIEHLSKVYKIFDKPMDRVKEALNPFRKRYSRDFYALNDVSLTIKKGETVGIIGKNGAGKSTILKIITGVLTPTSGSVQVNGRIASLLELGAGFNPEMTGVENIYMNGSIMGMTKAEITRKLDEIVDFAGVERYLDTPVKRFSSGMTVRLGFAVAAFLEPEILVVDEVLAVGDAEFQKKAIGKMQDISTGEGRTVLFVSHNMVSMQRLCKTGILLENGRLKYEGTISDTICQYLTDEIVQTSFEGIDGDESVMYLTKLSVRGNNADGLIHTDSTITVEFDVVIVEPVGSLVCGFNIFSSYHHPLARADYNDRNQMTSLEAGSYHFEYEIHPYTLANGEYKIEVDLAERNVKRYTTDKSKLVFSVVQSGDNFGNVFSESIPSKTSIIREDWLKVFEKNQ